MSLEDLAERWQALTRDQRRALADEKEAIKSAMIQMDIAALDDAPEVGE